MNSSGAERRERQLLGIGRGQVRGSAWKVWSEVKCCLGQEGLRRAGRAKWLVRRLGSGAAAAGAAKQYCAAQGWHRSCRPAPGPRSYLQAAETGRCGLHHSHHLEQRPFGPGPGSASAGLLAASQTLQGYQIALQDKQAHSSHASARPPPLTPTSALQVVGIQGLAPPCFFLGGIVQGGLLGVVANFVPTAVARPWWRVWHTTIGCAVRKQAWMKPRAADQTKQRRAGSRRPSTARQSSPASAAVPA